MIYKVKVATAVTVDKRASRQAGGKQPDRQQQLTLTVGRVLGGDKLLLFDFLLSLTHLFCLCCCCCICFTLVLHEAWHDLVRVDARAVGGAQFQLSGVTKPCTHTSVACESSTDTHTQTQGTHTYARAWLMAYHFEI